jgi:metallo-beta-lactamase class B
MQNRILRYYLAHTMRLFFFQCRLPSRLLGLWLVIFCFSQQTHGQEAESVPVKDRVALIRLTEDVAIHTSFKDFGQFDVSANGLAVRTKDGIVLIDATWDNAQARLLCKKVRKLYGQKVRYAIITHAHQDRIGGVNWLHKKKVIVIEGRNTAKIAAKQGYLPPDVFLDKDSVLEIGGVRFSISYPGAGHSPDNWVVGLEAESILFGGCLIKSASASRLGNTEDANLLAWREALKNIYLRFGHLHFIVPGHGAFKTTELIKFTDNLILQELKNGYK